MGHGASFDAVHPPKVLISISKYALIEKKCKNQFFRTNADEYEVEVNDAIKINDIGLLEILIQGGNIKDTLPLHLSAKYGSLDSTELLLSAGINPSMMDSRDRTALHIAAQNPSTYSVLLCSLLSSANKNILKLKDKLGSTALHIAAATGNLPIIKCLIEHGASTTVTNNAGQTPRYVATMHEHRQIVQYFDSLKSISKSKVKSVDKTEPVDMERVMQVWERFFENAFKHFESEMNAEIDFDNAMTVDVRGMKDAKKNASYFDEDDFDIRDNKIGKNKKKSSFEMKTNNRQQSYYHHDNDNQDDNEDIYDYGNAWCERKGAYNVDESDSWNEAAIWNWLSWFLTYDPTKEGESYCKNGYYISNLYDINVPHMSLDEFFEHQSQYRLWIAYPGDDEPCSLYPLALDDVVCNAWIIFFDIDSNTNVWMHIPSGNIQSYLPIGYDSSGLIESCELCPSDADCTWVSPPIGGATRNWMMVECVTQQKEMTRPSACNKKSISFNEAESIEAHELDELDGGKERWDWNGKENETESVVWYYFNRMSGHSLWQEPVGWNETIAESGGWALCSNELMVDFYWWNINSGEIQWYDGE